jgi:uncharacterized protein YbbK (DUF523 family)
MPQLRIGAVADPARPPRLPEVRPRLGTLRGRLVAVKVPASGPVLVSACLVGVPCTHTGVAKTRAWALKLVAEGRAVPVCPEVRGGLPIPRPEAEIVGGDGADVVEGRARVVGVGGEDVTANYLRGAEAARAAAARTGATVAILKARSPSCGCGAIYDGTFEGGLVNGDGVTAAVLKRAGLQVVGDEDVEV